jgi:hypothetical protein
MGSQRSQVDGLVVHVVSFAGLTGPAVTSTVMGDDPVAVLQEEKHLVVPVVTGQRPALAENDQLAGAPILVEDLHAVAGQRSRSSEPPLRWE